MSGITFLDLGRVGLAPRRFGFDSAVYGGRVLLLEGVTSWERWSDFQAGFRLRMASLGDPDPGYHLRDYRRACPPWAFGGGR